MMNKQVTYPLDWSFSSATKQWNNGVMLESSNPPSLYKSMKIDEIHVSYIHLHAQERRIRILPSAVSVGPFDIFSKSASS